MRAGNPSLRQHSGNQLRTAGRKMPRLQDENLADVSAGRVADRSALSRLLPGFWTYSRDGEMGRVFGDHDRAGVHGFARTHFAGRREFHRARVRPCPELFCEADRWHRPLGSESPIRIPSSGASAFFRGRGIGRGSGRRLTLAGVGSLLPAARTRRHGPGRRKNDADGGIVFGRQADAADNPGRLGARQRARYRRNSGTAQGRGLRIAVRNISRSRRVTRCVLRNAGRELVFVAADGAIMTKENAVMLAVIAPVAHHQVPVLPYNYGFAAGLVAFLCAGALVLIYMLRKYLRDESRGKKQDWSNPIADTENPSAFMAASMQGVIEKLRAQEKELARLHLLAQERAQESERLTEEVTRNMPTGLLLVNAMGAISSTNPAAEEALGIKPLRYRSYKEILGADSDLTRMLTACIRDGAVRNLGVTISPIYRTVRASTKASADAAPPQPQELKVSGALCLMSDLTELTALQKQIRWKENLAALGEMSAGIAHEFKNSLATISGYAQMI